MQLPAPAVHFAGQARNVRRHEGHGDRIRLSPGGAALIGAFIAKRKVAAAFEALNRRDVAAFIADWRDDCTFTYPGDIFASGTAAGRDAVLQWFRVFLDQFPTVRFTVKDLCVRNLFDLTGTTVVAAHWDLVLVNRQGREIRNSGVTIITVRFGKAVSVTDYLFDTGKNFRAAWNVA